MNNPVTEILNYSTLISNGLFIVGGALYAFSEPSRVYINQHVSRNVLWYTLAFSTAGSLGSLALSEIVGFPPCDLCWLQRIFMYPQVIISMVAIAREEVKAIYYMIPLTVIGWIISLYQSYIQWGGTSSLTPCTLDGGACGKLYIYAYNYVTIPFMAFSVFTYLLVVLLIAVFGKKD